MSAGQKEGSRTMGTGRSGGCVLISLHELGIATRDLRNQVPVVVVSRGYAAQRGG